MRAEDFWALRDVASTVEEGSSLGLIGHNGSGKTTLLKCIAGILRPTVGRRSATAGGSRRCSSSAPGFHPELTGRENVYLNASFLGLSRKRHRPRVRRHRRLRRARGLHGQPGEVLLLGDAGAAGFAVAVHVDPDILLIDEVLAVGDEAFQTEVPRPGPERSRPRAARSCS